MKILIIGSAKSKESQLLRKAGQERDHSVKIISISDLIFEIDQGLSIYTKEGTNIRNFQALLFRAISRHIIEAKIIAQYMLDKKRVVVDEILAKGNYEYHKFFMHHRLSAKKVLQPNTFYIARFDNLKTVAEKLKPPFIVKHIKEMRGRSNFRFDSEKELFDFFKQRKNQRLGRYIIQEWHPSEYYYRTLVVGNKVLGAIKRLSLHCQNRPQIPLSQRSKKAALWPALKEISLAATRAMDIELAGIDIMPDKRGRLQILEINRSPQFKRFIQTTGINAAEEVIKYLEEK